MAKIIKDIYDKFYTKEEVSKKLIELIDLSKYTTVVEPSAGAGSFSKHLLKYKEKFNYRTEFYDIEPDTDYIIKQDYLILDKSYDDMTLVIGNPPFGNNSNLAIKFINHSVKLGAKTIAFILPKSFRKESILNRLDRRLHVLNIYDIEDSSFLLNNKEYSVPTAFFVFECLETLRDKYISKCTSEYIEFVKYNELCDYTIRRVGVNAGKVFDKKDVSKESHFFVKSNNDIKEYLKNKKWIFNNSAGVYSLSKNEIIKDIESRFKK